MAMRECVRILPRAAGAVSGVANPQEPTASSDQCGRESVRSLVDSIGSRSVLPGKDKNSSKWGDPGGEAAERRGVGAGLPDRAAPLNLPGEPGEHLAARAGLFHGTYREGHGAGAGELPDRVRRRRPSALRRPGAGAEGGGGGDAPRDLPQVVLAEFSWTGADQVSTSITSGNTRLKELQVTTAALLVAYRRDVGCTPVIGSADALKYGTLSPVDQTYLRPTTYRAANARPIEHRDVIGLAQAWGSGLVASVDGMRFVVPVPSANARPDPRCFGRRGGAT